MYNISRNINVFHDRIAPEEGSLLVGYGAIIEHYGLKTPLPENLSVISAKHRKYSKDGWDVYTPRHKPEDSLYGHLIFALKYEGVDLAILHALFCRIDGCHIRYMINEDPTGSYSRRIWFLYEWLTGEELKIRDCEVINSVDVLDSNQYYVAKGELSRRHRVVNNLPGVRDFCPLVRKTDKLEGYISQNLKSAAHAKTKAVHPDILGRAAAFLLLKDSRASFIIEGERPGKNRVERWGNAISNAGRYALSAQELERLQNIVIEDRRFVKMGLRREGGFVGTHERLTNEPIPDHISARWQDLDCLMSGLIATNDHLNDSGFDPIIAATVIAFGFVFIHPFEDGNGRIQRYLIHHVLNEYDFSPDGIIFPVSATILHRVKEYKDVLEAYSKPRLDLVEWHATNNGNIEVDNETIDLYRYFDATKQAEFLYDCVFQTIEEVLPQEVAFLEKYDRMKTFINEKFDMPDYMEDLLIRFLEQNDGQLSNRAREGEFKALRQDEIVELEACYRDIFLG